MDITRAIAATARWSAGWIRAAHGRDDDERGQGMVEYALILVLIAIVVIVVLQVVGQQVNNVFSNVNNGLAS
jgi:pilus assembly protein Flp/PilA